MNNLTNPKNKMEKFSILPGVEWSIDFCVYLTLISNFLILLGNPFKNEVLVSLGTRIMIISVIILAIIAAVSSFNRFGVDKLHAWYMALFAISITAVIISANLSITSVVVPLVCFIMLPSYAALYRNVKNAALLKKMIYIANIINTILFIYLYFSDLSHSYYGGYGIITVEDLTLGYTNPNETGIYLFLSFLIMNITFRDLKDKYWKTITFVLTIFLLVMIFQTNSRSCTILAVLVVLLSLKRFIRGVCNYRFVNIVLILPFLFAVLFLLFPEFFDNLKILGESASTGRTKVYSNFLNNMSIMDFFVGNALKYPGSNLHNSYISVFAMLGMPALLIYLKYLKTIIVFYSNKLTSVPSYIAFLGFLAVILHGIAEGTLLVSGAVFAGLAGLLFILMLPDSEEKEV